jgi:Holliday junction resolvase RusA-like endonuclease
MEESVKSITFTILGKPSPSGSKKAFQHSKTGKIVVVDTAKGKAKWQNVSKRAALAAAKSAGWECTNAAVNLHVHFVFARPKSHYGTGKNSAILKPAAPFWHIQKPDRTKLLRCTEDAFKGVLWKDDSQVIGGLVSKVWGKEDLATVTVEMAP